MTKFAFNGNLPVVIVAETAHDWGDVSSVHVFGRNSDIDSAAREDVINHGGTYTYQSTGVTLFASSSDGSDTTEITIKGLSTGWERQTGTVTLNGTTQTEITGTTWRRVFEVENLSSTATSGDVYIAESDTTSSGVPDTASKIKAKMDTVSERSLMALYTVPAGYTGYLFHSFAAIGSEIVSGAADFELFFREEGGVFREFFNAGIVSSGTSRTDHKYVLIPSFPEKTDLVIRADVTDNNTVISGGFDLILVKNTGG